MITMQQLEELESRVIKALHLIGELRTENSHLEGENETLKSDVEDARLSLEEKEQEVERIKKELEVTASELKELKDKEEVLEKKLLGLLGKLDGLQSGGLSSAGLAGTDYSSKPEKAPAAEEYEKEEIIELGTDDDIIVESDEDAFIIEEKITDENEFDDLSVETVDSEEAVSDSDEEDIIIIDDESEIDSEIIDDSGDFEAGEKVS